MNVKDKIQPQHYSNDNNGASEKYFDQIELLPFVTLKKELTNNQEHRIIRLCNIFSGIINQQRKIM
jgi:hypothetical protein